MKRYKKLISAITIIVLVCGSMFVSDYADALSGSTGQTISPAPNTMRLQAFSPDGSLEMLDVPESSFRVSPAPAIAAAPNFEMVKLIDNGPDSQNIVVTIMGDGFTSSQQDTFIAAARRICERLKSMHPFASFSDTFNVYAIKVISSASGAANRPNALINNYFGSSFYFDNYTDRLLYISYQDKVAELINAYTPSCKMPIVIVNSTTYGGGGGKYAVSSINGSLEDLVVHEMGHSVGGLADEYWWQGNESAPNMTQNSNRGTIKWRHFLDVNNVGVYAHEENRSWYRPHQNCEMRYLGNKFCEVCAQELTWKMVQVSKDTYQPKTSITTTSLPSNAKRIVPYAFYNCESLTSVTIPASVKEIGNYAFLNCGKITTITNNATTPQRIDNTVFYNVNRSNVTVRVPAGTRNAYISAGWTGFKEVAESGGSQTGAAAPSITTQPTDKYVNVGGNATLSVSANVQRGALSYQWYSSSTKTNSGGSPISGATGTSYNAQTSTVGTRHYYCVVTNTDSAATGSKTATAVSAAATVTVAPAGASLPITIMRTRVNTWETSSPDAYTARCLFDGNENTFWHAKWNVGSGEIGKGEALVDIDLGTVKTVSKIELDKRVRSNGYDPIKAVKVFSHSQTSGTFPNGETMSSYTNANVATSQIKADFSTSGWTQVAGADIKGLTSGNSVRQTVTVTFSQPITARYIRLGVTCQDTVAGGGSNGYAQVSEIRVFDNGSKTNAVAPSITVQPQDKYVNVGAAATLSVSASVQRGTLSYQWYSASSKANSGGTALSGASGPSYSVPTGTIGTKYYYCVVTNTDSAATGSKTAAVASAAAAVTVATAGASLPITISRARVNTWETSSPDTYTARCLFDGNENTFWHAKWNQGSGEIGRGEAFADLDLGSVQTVTKIELDKRVRSNGYDPIKSVRVFSHSQTGGAFPNGETMNSYTAANVATSRINADFAMTGWVQQANPSILGLTTANSVRQTVTITLNQPITARYIRLGVVCQDTYAGRSADGYVQVSEVRVFGGAVNGGQQIDAAVPTISSQPIDKTVNVGEAAALSVTAAVIKGALSYQWYEATSKVNSGGSVIAGATGASYSPMAVAAGSKYYYCVVTNTDSAATGKKTATTVSSAVTVTVRQASGQQAELAISRVRVNTWETSHPDTYTARCLFDGNENTFWHAKWNQGSGAIGRGEAFADIDLGSVQTVTKIELDKRVRSNGYDPIKGVRVFSHSQTGGAFPNGETMSSYTAANVTTSRISADFAMTGWVQQTRPSIFGLTSSNSVRQTVTITLSQPITTRYIRLGVTCQDTYAGRSADGYAQVSEVRVFGGGGQL